MHPSHNHRRSQSHGRQARVNSSNQPKRDPVLPRMITYINNFSTGSIHLRDLQGRFNAFTIDKLWSYVRNNSSSFQIQRGPNSTDWNNPSSNDVVWVKTDLRLCEKHCRRDKKCLGDCGELHLCRAFLLLGDMCCSFQKSGKTCAFGHNFETQHNSKLLDIHDLGHMSDNELRILFRRRICRSVSTMPQICIYYNGKGGKGCSNKQCRSLHLCLDFVEEKCHGPCKKSHSMSDDQVAYILDLFAIDKSWPNDLVLEDLRSIMNKRIRHNSDVSSVASAADSVCGDSDDDSNNESKGYATGGVDRTNTRRKAVRCCSHCQELRTEMMKMKEKIHVLEKHLDDLKMSTATSTSKAESVEVEEEDQFSHNEKLKLAQQLLPIVTEMQPELSEQITKMILDMEKSQLKRILISQENLKAKITEAARLLNSFRGK